MEAASDTSRQVNKVCGGSQSSNEKNRGSSRSRRPKNVRNSRAPNHDNKPVVCFCCGRPGHRAKDSSCPAAGKTCNNCGKQGHFPGVCKGAPKRVTDSPNIAYQRNANGLRYVTVEDNAGSDDECLFAIGGNMEDNTVQITVEGTLIPVIVDSGASVNVLDSATFNRLSDSGVVLRDSCVKIYAYGSKSPLPVKGIFNANVSTPQVQTQTDFVVVENLHARSLLGKKRQRTLVCLELDRNT